MKTLPLTETVGTITAKDYPKAKVFNEMGIDLYFSGNKTPEGAFKELGTNEKQLKVAMEEANIATVSSQDFNKWHLGDLTDYIINTHHRYAKENACVILDMVQKAMSHHGENHPELPKLAEATFLFLHDLLNHMIREEQNLFPNIRQLVKNRSEAGTAKYPTFGIIKDSLILMMKKHEVLTEDMTFLRRFTNDYRLLPDAHSSYNYLLAKMKEFEYDLLLHVHLENNILFSKALHEAEEFYENEFAE